MWRSPEPRYDVASGLSQGGREYQEDAIIADFPFGVDSGVAVLADGMGGHEAGDIASKLVVSQVFAELKLKSADFAVSEQELPDLLTDATRCANDAIRSYVEENPQAYGMGATLVATILVENRLRWMSVGDSPLYLLRDGKLQQLNQDHSLAPQIDFMVKQGLIDPEVAKDHPDRNCLTSVIMGRRIAKVDCPETHVELKMGDVLVVSSDGLQYLGEAKIQKILHRYRKRKASEIVGYLLEGIAELADPDQDNVSIMVLKLNHTKPVEAIVQPKPLGQHEESSASLTRVVVADSSAITPEPKADAAFPYGDALGMDHKHAVGEN